MDRKFVWREIFLPNSFLTPNLYDQNFGGDFFLPKVYDKKKFVTKKFVKKILSNRNCRPTNFVQQKFLGQSKILF